MRPHNRVSVFIIATIWMAACTSEPINTLIAPASTAVPPAITSTLTAMPPTPTAPPVTPTSALPTTAPTAVPPTEISPGRGDSRQIRITVNGTELTATLNDSQTTRDFIALLPLTLTLEDYGSTEKISNLPVRLSIEGAPSGSDPSVGDLAYYAPWGNLAIFYQDFGFSNGLIILGKIDGGVEALSVSGSVNVTIERME